QTDIRDSSQVQKALDNLKPDVVLNAAGITGRPNVDWCEDPKNKFETFEVNVLGAVNIAKACDQFGIYLAHIGSGCIYQGNNDGQGFTEDDPQNFFGSFYSRTKGLSEDLLKPFNPLQLRVRIPIESAPSPKNVIDKLLKYEKIISVENSFTVVPDFLKASYALIDRKEKGIFNMTNAGSTDHQYIMDKYKEIVDPDYNYALMSLDELKQSTVAERSNCVLNTDKRENLGIKMPPIKERIIEVLREYKK
ncbi:MAG TPA: sugar nucleotide-binding protein, partial [Patescibacteria group bacterium]